MHIQPKLVGSEGRNGGASDRAPSVIGQAVASIAHDLRRPIGAIRAAADFLRSNSGDPAAVERIAREMEGSMSSIERLVDDLLAFSKDGSPIRIVLPASRHLN